jgi:hypothetical protein
MIVNELYNGSGIGKNRMRVEPTLINKEIYK